MLQAPTPTKLVVMMSAAGLGLMWSGVAFGSRGGDAPAGYAMPLDVALQGQKSDSLDTYNGWVSYSVPEGALTRTIVADARAVAFPSALEPSAGEPARTTRKSEVADHGVMPSTGFDGGASVGNEINALAWVLMEDPRPLLAASRSADASTQPGVSPPRTRAGTASGESDRSAIPSARATGLQRPAKVTFSAPAATAATATPEGRLARTAASAANGASTVSAVGPVTAEQASIERVWASLAEVLGTQGMHRPVSAEPGAQRAAARDDAMRARKAEPATAGRQADKVLETLALVQASRNGSHAGSGMARLDSDLASAATRTPLQAAAGLHAAGLEPEVDIDLNALAVDLNLLVPAASAQADDSVRIARQSEDAAAMRQADKVLQTLALVQSTKPERADRSATRRAPGLVPAKISQSPEPMAGSAIVGLALALELDVDLSVPAEVPRLQPDLPRATAGGRLAPHVVASAALETAARSAIARPADKVLETLSIMPSANTGRTEGRSTTPLGELVSPNALGPLEPAASAAIAGLEPQLDIDLDRLAVDLNLNLLEPAAEVTRLSNAATPAASPESANAPPSEGGVLGDHVVAVNSDRLDEIRGGFVTDSGLKISFGIERAVYLNGTLVSTTSLNIADLSKISGGRADVSGDAAGVLTLVQSGSGNVFAPGSVSNTAAGTIIQNTLDNQRIGTITRIDAVVNSASILRSINLQSSMRSAVVDSLLR